MSAVARLVIGSSGGDAYPIDRKPIPAKTGASPTDRGAMLRRALQRLNVGDHFICDLAGATIRQLAYRQGIKVTPRRRPRGGFDVWRHG